MERCTITCESCERIWSLQTSFSLYERQTIESRPCPHCGAYTLTCSLEPELLSVDSSAARRWSTVAL